MGEKGNSLGDVLGKEDLASAGKILDGPGRPGELSKLGGLGGSGGIDKLGGSGGIDKLGEIEGLPNGPRAGGTPAPGLGGDKLPDPGR